MVYFKRAFAFFDDRVSTGNQSKNGGGFITEENDELRSKSELIQMWFLKKISPILFYLTL